MSVLCVRGLEVTHRGAAAPSLEAMDLDLEAGTLTLITGPTGCGKSTLLHALAGLLQRHGGATVRGEVHVAGLDPAAADPGARVALLGWVDQNPADQLVTHAVGDELAFALESAAWEPEAIEARIASLHADLDLPGDLDRATSAMSGGQAQRLVLGASIAARPRVLLLDEPLAQLDPKSSAQVVDRVHQLAKAGVAVLVVEHRVDALWPVCDRVLILDEGRLVADSPRDSLALDDLHDRGLRLPLEAVSRPPASPPVIEPGSPKVAIPPMRVHIAGNPVVDLNGLVVHAGERIALVGANGAGKSSLLGALGGLDPTGVAEVDPPVDRGGQRWLAVPQDPDLMLIAPSVREELEWGPRALGLPASPDEVASVLALTSLLDRSPHALSRGQRMRCAVAAALSCRPDLLLLDEPSAGQDHHHIEAIFRALTERGCTVIWATHDQDLALRHATRLWVMDAGRIVADGPPAQVLAELPEEGPLPLSPAVRLCRDRGWPMGSLWGSP